MSIKHAAFPVRCIGSIVLLGAGVLGAGCFQDSTPQHSLFLPLDYKSSFQPVRPCRMNAGHDNTYQMVLANAVAAAPYNNGESPLPADSVVIAELHADATCNSLKGFYLMANDKAGYHTAHGDWHWQQLDDNERVTQDGRLNKCISCHAQTTCTDYLCSAP
jgi:hypothetical protein